MKKGLSSHTLAELALLLLAVLWGSTFYVSQYAMQTTSPIFLLCIRFALASLLITLCSFPQWKAHKRIRWSHAIILGLLIGTSLSLQNIGLSKLSAARGAFIAFSYAVLIPPLQLIIVKKPLRMGSLFGLLLALAGVFFMVAPEAGTFHPGDIATICSSIIFAFYIIFIDKFGDTDNFWPFVSIQFAVASLCCLALALIFEPIVLHIQWSGLLAIFYLATFGTAIALSLQVRFQHRTSPTRATVILSLEGVFAAIIGYALGGQLISLREGIGAVVIIAGVLVSELFPFKRKANVQSA